MEFKYFKGLHMNMTLSPRLTLVTPVVILDACFAYWPVMLI